MNFFWIFVRICTRAPVLEFRDGKFHFWNGLFQVWYGFQKQDVRNFTSLPSLKDVYQCPFQSWIFYLYCSNTITWLNYLNWKKRVPTTSLLKTITWINRAGPSSPARCIIKKGRLEMRKNRKQRWKLSHRKTKNKNEKYIGLLFWPSIFNICVFFMTKSDCLDIYISTMRSLYGRPRHPKSGAAPWPLTYMPCKSSNLQISWICWVREFWKCDFSVLTFQNSSKYARESSWRCWGVRVSWGLEYMQNSSKYAWVSWVHAICVLACTTH